MSEPSSSVTQTSPSSPAEEHFALCRRLGLDGFTLRTRILPPAFVASPLIVLALTMLPALDERQKWWAMLPLGATPLIALVARRAGRQIEFDLFIAWGGMPTTRRLRFTEDDADEAEIARRHQEVERILGGGLVLPTNRKERRDPDGADRAYASAMKRIVARVRNNPEFPLVNKENASYGYARNLYGLKKAGVGIALLTLLVSAGMGGWAVSTSNVGGFGWLSGAALAATLALALWSQVDAAFVKTNADGYADRVIDALDELPSAP